MPPKTKAGKRRKAAKVMREYHEGELYSSSGHKVTKPSQAKAIAMSESGQSRKRKKGKR